MRPAFAALMFLTLIALAACASAEPLPLFGPPLENTPVITYQGSEQDKPPASHDELSAWLAAHQRVENVNMRGGNFWLTTRFTPSTTSRTWVVSLANTWFRQAEITVLGDDGLHQHFQVSPQPDKALLLRGGHTVELQPGHSYAVLVNVTSPFYTSLPRIDIQTQSSFRARHSNELVLMLGALGLLGGLGGFILFLGLWIRDRSYLLYGLQSLILMLGWSFYFGLPRDWLGLDTGRINFTLWFIILPIVNALFTVRFLGLGKSAPGLRNVGLAIAAVSAVALPVSLIFPSYAFFIATTMVSVVVLFSAGTGIWAMGHGVRQARFFVLAFLGVLLPGAIILPANLGLMPDLVDNSDLLTLIGNGCEAMLLAFALADHVKLVERGRERFRRGMQEAIAKASIDPLTGLGNRLAFNLLVEDLTNQPDADRYGVLQIAMIDLDGLKQINDNYGHERGDQLLRAASHGLRHLEHPNARSFRLGGDEFAVIAFGDDLSLQRLTNALAELDLNLRRNGYENAGISFGVCSGDHQNRLTGSALAGLVRRADRAMYAQKSRRQQSRASGQSLPT